MNPEQVKYRVYDKVLEEMLYGVNLMFDYDKSLKWLQHDEWIDDGGIESSHNFRGIMPITDENLVLMRYTGFKDKEGVDIYENDLLISPVSSVLMKVIWIQTIGQWSLTESPNNLYLEAGMSKVVGNVYDKNWKLDSLEEEL